ncbi:MAG: hypothetical protein K8T91_04900 [Planctomycetes bacterium]|nr:hypothetical protein [Planctomycetota bacterium]
MIQVDELFALPEMPTRPAPRRTDSRRERFFKRREKEERQEARIAAEAPRTAQRPASGAAATVDSKPQREAKAGVATVIPQQAVRRQSAPQESQGKTATRGPQPVRSGGQPRPEAEVARRQALTSEETYPDDHPIDDPSLLDPSEVLTSQSEIDLEAFDLYRTGMSYRQLADHYAIHLNTAFDRVRRGREVEAAQRRRSPDELLIAELSKLQRIERAVILGAYAGEMDAIRLVVRLITLRERLQKTAQRAVQAAPASVAPAAPLPHREEQGEKNGGESRLPESELAEFREILKKRLPEHADEFHKFDQQAANPAQTAKVNPEPATGGAIDDGDEIPSSGKGNSTSANAARTEREHFEAGSGAKLSDVTPNGARSPASTTACRIAPQLESAAA